MLRNKKIVSLILVATLLASLSPFLMVTYAEQQNQEQQNEREQMFMELAIQARERAYSLRELVIDETGNIPDEVEALLNEADKKLAEGTIQKNIEAMNQYRNAYRYLYRYLEQHGVDIETPERTIGMLAAINRMDTRIDRIRQIRERIENTYMLEMDAEAQQYLSWVEGNLTEAEKNREQAMKALTVDWNFADAAYKLKEANENIQKAQIALQLSARWSYRWRIRNFLGELDRIRERIRTRIRERVQQGGFNINAILEEMGYTSLEDFYQEIDELMENARQKMEIREAVQAMWTIMKKLNEMNLAIQNRWQGGN